MWEQAIPIAISLISVTAICVVFVMAIRVQTSVLSTRLDGQDTIIKEIKDEIKSLSGVVVSIAVQNQRLDHFEQRQVLGGKRVDEIERRLNVWTERWWAAKPNIPPMSEGGPGVIG